MGVDNSNTLNRASKIVVRRLSLESLKFVSPLKSSTISLMDANFIFRGYRTRM